MRDHIRLLINDREFKVSGHDAFLTLSEFLRSRCGLTGTKIVCSEGDCGSCSVLCRLPGKPDDDYRPIDSCIRFVFQLDGSHIVTIEGIKRDDQLHPIQEALIDCHGSQCGFCTPGFVIAMTGLGAKDADVDEPRIRNGLTGNLCRCTGYTPIIQAGLKACQPECAPDAPALDSTCEPRSKGSVEVAAIVDGLHHHVFCPPTLDEALAFLAARPDAKVVAGATDVGVQHNKGHVKASTWLDLNRIAELECVAIEDNCLTAGARATWSDLEFAIAAHVPELRAIISRFGSPQIRHVGTLGGNIINASPIADSLPFLLVCDAQLTFSSHNEPGDRNQRTIDINDFYRGYKDFDLRRGELLTQISVQLPTEERLLRLYKVSRRRDLDIASFTGAIWVEIDGGYIVDAGIAYGAVGPVVTRLTQTEAYLRGKPFSIEAMSRAGDVAASEISPITDVRGRAEYRLQLARNVLKKFYFQVQREAPQAI